MTTLEERFQASQPVLIRLGRADANGIPLGNAMMAEIAPDQWRLIREACFGVLWTRPGLSMEQRSLGFTEAQIKELFFHLSFYTGVSLARRGSAIARKAFNSC